MLILGSSSPRRRELLALITPDFTVHTGDVDESTLTAPTPVQLAQVLAEAKCTAVAKSFPDDAVIGCDTVVDVDGIVFGKPKDIADARRMMQTLSGRTHFVHTGVCIKAAGQTIAFADTTKVTFAPISEDEIAAYIATDEPYDKAGSYGVQGLAAKFVTQISGCYFNVMGFPVACVYAALKKIGVKL